MLKVYTDGACLDNGKSENVGAWAYFMAYRNHEKKDSDFSSNTTNNQMELLAVINALKSIKKKNIKVMVYSDSAYIVNCINDKWYVKWRKNNWIKPDKKEVKNLELWKRLIELFESFNDINIFHVRSHLDLSNKVLIQKELIKFNSKNKTNISLEEFEKILKGNKLVDEMASAKAIERNLVNDNWDGEKWYFL